MDKTIDEALKQGVKAHKTNDWSNSKYRQLSKALKSCKMNV
mgnify:CR=1 FL=1